ncbi:MAG: hypothetical protein ACLGG0_14825 [Bacteriovoracia bacterium]
MQNKENKVLADKCKIGQKMKLDTYKILYKTGDQFFDGKYFYFITDKENVALDRVEEISLPFSTYQHEQKVLLKYKSLKDNDTYKSVLLDDLKSSDPISGRFASDAKEIIYRFVDYYEAIKRKATVSDKDLKELEVHFKNLKDLKTYYFFGASIPFAAKDAGRTRWILLTASFIVILFFLDFFYSGIIISLISIMPLAIYYEGRLENYSINKFRKNNFFHISNETNILTSKIEMLTRHELPKIDGAFFISSCYSFFTPENSSRELKTEVFNLLDVFGAGYDGHLYGHLHSFSHDKTQLLCHCIVFYKDKHNKMHTVSEFYAYLPK